MRRHGGGQSGGEWDEWSTDASWSQPAANTVQPSAPSGHMAAAAGSMPSTQQEQFTYQAPAPAMPQPYAPMTQQQQQNNNQFAAPCTPQPYAAPTARSAYTGSIMMPGAGGGSGGGSGSGSGSMGGSGGSGGDLSGLLGGAAAQWQASGAVSGGGGGGGGGGVDSLAGAATGAASALGLDNASAMVMGQVASQVATNAAMNVLGADQLQQLGKTFTGSRLAVLRYYFDVSNQYVLAKMQILALPYRHKEWERQLVTVGGGQYAPKPPSEDINAPDLYLPLMGYVTYILVAGYVSGADGRFTPEVLGTTARCARLLRAACCVLGAGCWVPGAGCRVMGHGSWVMGHGSWVMGHGSWVMGHG
jgi:hypothetical protein